MVFNFYPPRSPRLPADEHEIVLHNDGSWDPLPPKKDDLSNVCLQPVKPKPVSISTTVIDSDTDSSNNTPGPSSGDNSDIACITLDSDTEDEDEGASSNKRARLDDPPSSPDIICLDDD